METTNMEAIKELRKETETILDEINRRANGETPRPWVVDGVDPRCLFGYL